MVRKNRDKIYCKERPWETAAFCDTPKYGTFRKKKEEPMKTKGKWLDESCNSCGRQINTWDKRISKVLAYKYPCCEECIAKEYDVEPEALRSRMENIFGMRPCLGL